MVVRKLEENGDICRVSRMWGRRDSRSVEQVIGQCGLCADRAGPAYFKVDMVLLDVVEAVGMPDELS